MGRAIAVVADCTSSEVRRLAKWAKDVPGKHEGFWRIADGALGFWKAAGEIWPTTREQRCWVHKTANVLAKLTKSALFLRPQECAGSAGVSS
jgi:transposase-like protein